jgi:hypothetical protein
MPGAGVRRSHGVYISSRVYFDVWGQGGELQRRTWPEGRQQVVATAFGCVQVRIVAIGSCGAMPPKLVAALSWCLQMALASQSRTRGMVLGLLSHFTGLQAVPGPGTFSRHMTVGWLRSSLLSLGAAWPATSFVPAGIGILVSALSHTN